MSKLAFNFLRPYLHGASRSLKPHHTQAYVALQRRFAQSTAADAYTGPHDVEKQKRLEHLAKIKPLGDYHPRLVYSANAQNLSVRDFNTKYEGISETASDVVSVFGRMNHHS
jgi:lysyl-tRNA synthetase class 2